MAAQGRDPAGRNGTQLRKGASSRAALVPGRCTASRGIAGRLVVLAVVEHLAAVERLQRAIVHPLEVGENIEVRGGDGNWVLEKDPGDGLGAGRRSERARVLQASIRTIRLIPNR
jgi:hypothetical protein